MSNTSIDAIPRWKQLCEAALFELDPAKLLLRIAEARSAILDQIEDGFSKLSNAEQVALRDVLETLRTLRMIAERDNNVERKDGNLRAVMHARHSKRQSS